MSGGTPTNTRTEAAQRSRRRLLDLGVELLYEGLRSPITGVRAADVAARSEWSTGALYHHWTNQDEFRADLRQHIVNELDLARSIEAVTAAVGGEDADPASAIRTAFQEYVRDVLADRAWWLQVAMLASADPDDQSTVQHTMLTSIELLEQFYTAMLSLFELEMRPGFSVNWLTRSIMALVDGYSLQYRAGLPFQLAADWPNDFNWENADLALAGLVAVSVRRINHDADGDIDTVWNELFGRTS